MLDQFVQFFEGSFVEQDLDALARGQPALPVLALATVGAAALLGPANLVPKNRRLVRHGRLFRGLVRKTTAVGRATRRTLATTAG
jgi:hypothetical protein